MDPSRRRSKERRRVGTSGALGALLLGLLSSKGGWRTSPVTWVFC